ncbi:MAG: choice-of-anchor D domain-containing protein, partial [Actinomycetota bacterium]
MRGRALALGACVVVGSFAMLASALAAGPPEMSVTPSQRDFGSLCAGASQSANFTITNTQQNSDDLVINSITRSGSLQFTPQSVPTPSPIPAEKSSVFSVTFTAPSHGSVNATYNVNASNATDRSVSVTGRGVDRKIASDRPSVSFGEQRVGSRSPTQALLIRNPGQDPVTISSIRRVGNNAKDFRVTVPSVPFSIAAGDFVSFSLSFQPTGAGLRNATL